MQKTQNYNLNKPEATDPLRVADFNENTEIIDAALGNIRSEAANNLATYKASNDAAVGVLTGRAKVAVGSYIGDNTSKHTIPLEFTPRFVLVMSQLNDKVYLTIATPEFGGCVSSSSFGLSDSRCVANGFYISGNANYSAEGNYYLAVE